MKCQIPFPAIQLPDLFTVLIRICFIFPIQLKFAGQIFASIVLEMLSLWERCFCSKFLSGLSPDANNNSSNLSNRKESGQQKQSSPTKSQCKAATTYSMGGSFEDHPNGLGPQSWIGQFHEACGKNDLAKAKSLVSALQGKDVRKEIDGIDIDFYTPLHRSCENGCQEVCAYLLELGARPDVSHPGLDGWTPLHIAAWKDKLEIVKLLLADDRVDTEALDWYGNKAVGLTKSDEIKKLINAHAETKGVGKEDAWKDQKLRETCQMVPSAKQAAMIEYSMKRSAEGKIGGEWDQAADKPKE